jgi:hypothetical protein
VGAARAALAQVQPTIVLADAALWQDLGAALEAAAAAPGRLRRLRDRRLRARLGLGRLRAALACPPGVPAAVRARLEALGVRLDELSDDVVPGGLT